ncbi:MAG TPA: hypothetical protein VHQ44_06565, partial [Thermoanaerobaculia bacterium]|nr:hypothetical protein [Thermoanaerobaculia bacterium]
MRRGRTFSLLLQLLPIAAATALPDPARAASPAPTLSPWLKIVPGDARIGRLAAKAAAPLSPNAPGLLLKLDPPGWKAGNTAAREAVRALAVDAHRAGWRWGLDLELPDVTIPADVRAAESATVEDLWPGLGEIFRDAKETDLVTIGFAAQEGFDPKGRSYLLRKGSAGARAATASAASGEALDVFRFVARTDLGGVVLIPGTAPAGRVSSGAFSLTLDGTAYSLAEVYELETGASKRIEVPVRAVPARLSLSLANGPLGVRLVAREKLPSEAAVAAVGVAATRGLTADEILAKHQAWRAARDARWKMLTARNTMSMRFRFAELNNTFDLALAGPFFYEKGGSYDWAWSEAYFNGVRWKGKKIPELPLLQPEKVSDMPLALTFDDAYAYTLAGEDTVNRVPCWALDFTPRAAASDKPLYAGTVWVAKADFAAIRTRARQLNLTAEIQAVDEVSDFGEVPAPDGGPPLRLPTHTTGQWILKTFSRTTVIERESTLSDVRLDPPGFLAARQAAFASQDVMVRDTEKGVRYLEKTKEGGRAVTEDMKRGHLFGLGGVFYDSSFDYPL